jgi:hypothetical protein
MPELRHRRAPAAPATLDRAARTVEVTASTFAPVPLGPPDPTGAFNPWIEALDPAGVDLAEFAGAPVLADHVNRVDGLIGLILSARVTAAELRAVVRFAETARATEIMGLVADGTLRGVSIGYSVASYRRTGEQRGRPVFTATKWRPRELSFVPIPADAGARVRADGADSKGTLTVTNTPVVPDHDAVRAERERVAALDAVAIASRALMPAERVDRVRAEAVSAGWTPEALRAALWDQYVKDAKPSVPARPEPVTGRDATLSHRMAEGLAARVLGRPVQGPAEEWRGASIPALAAACLEARGERVGRHDPAHELITRALTTSDFPLVLGATVGRILQARLEAAPGAVRAICARREARDFRQGQFIEFAGPASLARVLESGEIQTAPPNERGTTYAVQTFARQMRITRQALVNDDLAAFDMATVFANAVTATEAAEFVKMFATNGAGWGPTLPDGQPLFHSTRGNVSAGTVSTAGIAAGRQVMRGQRDASGNLVAPAPAVILVGPAGETAAEAAVSDLALATTEAERPVFSGKLRVLTEPRLEGAPWFLFADPTVQPVLALIYLARTGGVPQVTEYRVADFDGVAWNIVHDFTIAPMTHVGAVRLTGA